MDTKEIQIFNANIKYNDKGLTIINSYKIKKKSEMELILNLFLIQTKFESKRTVKSWIKEWKAHNRLYKLGLFKKHTQDTDLEENESLYRLLIYNILGI